MLPFNVLIKNTLQIILPLTIGSFILKRYLNSTLKYLSSNILLEQWDSMCRDLRTDENQLNFQRLTQEYLQNCKNDDMYAFQKLIDNIYIILQEDNKLNKGRIIVLCLFIEYNFHHSNVSRNYFIKMKNKLQKDFIEM